MTADVGEHGKRSGGNDRAANGQPVQAVSQVHCITCPYNHQHHKNDERKKRDRPQTGIMHEAINYQVGMELFQKWYNQLCGIHAAILHGNQRHGDESASQNLQPEIGARGKAEISLMNNFYIVIREADGGESTGCEHGDPYKSVLQIGPEQGGNDDGDHDQDSAHGWSSGLLLMCLRAFLADVLPDLEVAQAINHQWTDN